jgi:hypothetical protein
METVMDQEHIDALELSRDELLRRFREGDAATVATPPLTFTARLNVDVATYVSAFGVWWSAQNEDPCAATTISLGQELRADTTGNPLDPITV